MEIEWKDIPGTEGRYKVNQLGQVFSNTTGKILKPQKTKNTGYIQYKLMLRGSRMCFTGHRLVAELFIPNPLNKPQVNHKDGDKTNNHISNLEWSTRSENMTHAKDMGLINYCKGTDRENSKFTERQVRIVKWCLKYGVSQYGLASIFNCSRSTILNIHLGTTWQHIQLEQ